jgi:5-methylcytosine-specific restriction endonuclease McrA
MTVTPRQFRSTYAWKQARKRMLRSAGFCAICGGALRPDLGPQHALSPTVDHVIALSRLDLTSAAGRAAALGSGNLRVVHRGCNSRRGAGTATRAARQVPAPQASGDHPGVVWSRCWVPTPDGSPCGRGLCHRCRGVQLA